jgi:hypothetical protein
VVSMTRSWMRWKSFLVTQELAGNMGRWGFTSTDNRLWWPRRFETVHYPIRFMVWQHYHYRYRKHYP